MDTMDSRQIIWINLSGLFLIALTLFGLMVSEQRLFLSRSAVLLSVALLKTVCIVWVFMELKRHAYYIALVTLAFFMLMSGLIGWVLSL